MPAPSHSHQTVVPMLYQEWIWNSGWQPVTGGNGNGTTYSDIVNIGSSVTPGFRSLKKWQLPVRPYTKIVTREIDVYQSTDTYHNGFPVSIYNYFQWTHRKSGWTLDMCVEADDPYPKAVSDILNKLNSSSTNTLVAMAEVHKTASLVATSATRIFTAIRALRRGHLGDFSEALGISVTRTQSDRFHKRFRSYKKYRKTRVETKTTVREFAQSTWLEYSYGWKPLVNDVFNHAKALADSQYERQNVTRLMTSKKSSEQSGSLVEYSGPLLSFTNNTHDKRYCAVGVWYRPTVGGTINPMITFGVINPLEVVWEIVPFSFVVDWFLPIGDYLKSLSATAGLTFASGYVTTKRETTITGKLTATGGRDPATGPAYLTRTVETSDFSNYRFVMNRTKMVDFPAPVFPSFKDPRSIAHATSAIALLSSLFLTEKRGGR